MPDRYELAAAKAAKELAAARARPPKWVALNLSRVVPASVKDALRGGRGALAAAQKTGAATVNALEAAKGFVSLMAKLEAALGDAVGTAAAIAADQVRDVSKQFESTGVYVLPILNVAKKSRRRARYEASGPWWGTSVSSDGASSTWPERAKAAVVDAVMGATFGKKGLHVEPQTFDEFKDWIATKLREDEPAWAEPATPDDDFLKWASKRARWKPKRVGAPYTPWGDVSVWIVVAAAPDPEEFVSVVAALDELTSAMGSDLGEAASAATAAFTKLRGRVWKDGDEATLVEDVYAAIDDAKSAWAAYDPKATFSGSGGPPYWIGVNAGTVFPEVFQTLERVAAALESLRYREQLTFLDAIKDSISGAQNTVLALMETIQQIDRAIFLLQKLMSMPGLYAIGLHSSVSTDSLADMVSALESPWNQQAEAEYKAALAGVNAKRDSERRAAEARQDVHEASRDAAMAWLNGLSAMAAGLGNPDAAWYSALPAFAKAAVDSRGFSLSLPAETRRAIAVEAYGSFAAEKIAKRNEYSSALSAVAAEDRAIAAIEDARANDVARIASKRKGPLADLGDEKYVGGEPVRVVAPTDVAAMSKNEKMYYAGFVVAACAAKGPGALKTYTQAMADEHAGAFSPVVDAKGDAAAGAKDAMAKVRGVLKMLGLS